MSTLFIIDVKLKRYKNKTKQSKTVRVCVTCRRSDSRSSVENNLSVPERLNFFIAINRKLVKEKHNNTFHSRNKLIHVSKASTDTLCVSAALLLVLFSHVFKALSLIILINLNSTFSFSVCTEFKIAKTK